jgi:hypothetical protein
MREWWLYATTFFWAAPKRFLSTMFDGAEGVVYASLAEGGAQTALATVSPTPWQTGNYLRGTPCEASPAHD